MANDHPLILHDLSACCGSETMGRAGDSPRFRAMRMLVATAVAPTADHHIVHPLPQSPPRHGLDLFPRLRS
jgi:hypothetical protein